MRKFVLDTGILLHYVRQSQLANTIEGDLGIMAEESVPIIASVSVGEMEGFVQRQEWGNKKIDRLKKLVSRLIVINIKAEDENLIDNYATLWNYSKNNLPGDKLGHAVGINQNDAWIAALTRTVNAELVTTDNDFDHLNHKWVTVHQYPNE
jgi:predicted nucleic acid-binding protein